MAVIKPITAELIRKHLGPRASIKRRLFGGFNVTTPTGGEIEIHQRTYKIYCGGDDVYHAMMSLTAEAWDSISVQGPPEHILATMAHGDALGIPVIPEVKASGGCLRFIVASIVFVFAAGFFVGDSQDSFRGICVGAFAAWLVWGFIKRRQQRNARRRAQRYRFQYPQTHGGERRASREDARETGWL
jgi:hypothetical protein